jgi:hypothetical protein
VSYTPTDTWGSESTSFPDLTQPYQSSQVPSHQQELCSLFQNDVDDTVQGFAADSPGTAGDSGYPTSDGVFRDLIDTQLGQLNSDGDSAVFQLRAEVKAAAVVGVKGQYGYRVEVTQNGGDLPAGATGEVTPAEYEVSFDKRLLAGINGEIPFPVIDPKGELNLRSADRVSMTFDTQEEASQAVELLARLSASETLQDTGSLTSPSTASPGEIAGAPRNPLVDQDGSGSSSLSGPSLPDGPAETILNVGADVVAPNADEMAFLTDHITSYATHLDAQARAALGADLPLGVFKLGGELRLDEVSGITRTVELPRDGEPGRVTYTFAIEDEIRSKEGAAVGVQIPDVLKAGIGLNNRMDHASWTREVSMSWEFGENEMDGPAISGHSYPEVSAALAGDLGLPDRVSIRLDAGLQDQPIWDLSRTDFVNTSVELTIDQPGEAAGTAIQAALNGDLNGAMTAMGDNAQLTLTNQHTERSGFDLQPEASLKVVDIANLKASLIMEAGVDDVTRREEVVIGGQPVNTPADETPTTDSDQVVVLPREGLTLRDGPAGERSSVFYHGTFLDPTGNHEVDGNGQGWTEVNGLDVNDNPVTGWVSDAYIAAHPEGAMNDEGRINPELEASGYRAHRVVPGDNVWDIAAANGCDFNETVALNGDHLIDPSLIFEGDVVYLPVIDTPPPVADPVDPPVDSIPSTPSEDESVLSPPGSETVTGSGSSSDSGSETAPSPTTPTSGNDTPTAGDSPSPSGSSSLSGTTPDAPVQDPIEPTTTVPPADSDPDAPLDTDAILTQYQVQDSQEPLIELYQPRFIREMQETNLLGISPWDVVEGAGDLWGGLADTLGLEGTEIAGLPVGEMDAAALNQLLSLEDIPVEEAALLDEMSPQELFEMWGLKNTASGEANRLYPWEGEVHPVYGQNDGHNDAFRHTYWNALMTAHFGEEFAIAYANAHEATPGNPGAREAMDLFNNELGRSIAMAHPEASDAELAEYVHQALINGDALVLDAQCNLAPSHTVGLHQHGLSD